MRITFRATSCLCFLFAAACARQEPAASDRALQTVTIGSAPGVGIDSRTSLGGDGFTVRWTKGDRIALWAVNGVGDTQLQAVPFMLYSFDTAYQSAKFTGTIAPMPQDTYVYYALYPVPASAEGTEARYTLPATQDGTYRSSCDVMVATPVTGEALAAGDNSDAVSLSFAHKVHLLKIRIPENRMNEPITRLQLTFPQPVVGTLTVDAAAPDEEPALTEGSNVLTLDFAAPVDAGDVVYAMIAPVDIAQTAPVTLQAFCESGESETVSMPGKHFAAGHSTPIALTIPALSKRYTKLVFTLTDTGEETLGEKIGRLVLTGPEGCDLGQGGNTYTFEVNEAGSYEIIYKEGLPAGISEQPFTVQYDSENALIAESFVMPRLEENASNAAATFSVPYLFAEDFSGMSSFSIDDANGTNATSGGSNSASSLPIPVLHPEATGWTGARCGGEAGKAVRICSRSECAALTYGNYHGRIDSPNLANIKQNKHPDICISFTYSFGRNACHGNFLQPYMAFGVTTASDRNTVSKTGNDSNILKYRIPDACLYDIEDGGALDGSFDRVHRATTGVVVRGCSSEHRLVWEVYMKNYEPRNAFKYYYSNNWVYIDNIKVSIAK